MHKHGIRWPFAVIDFESSSLDDMSYPIEVGVAIWTRPNKPIWTWSSLIEPAPEWVRDGVWTETSQKVHGISPYDLEGVPRSADVMRRLNEVMLGVDAAVSDNPYWERKWLDTLAKAAGVTPRFVVEPLCDRIAGLAQAARQRLADHVAAHPAPHRAGPDALGLVRALAAGIAMTPDEKGVAEG